MQVLTPFGYVDVSTLQPGDLVSAFDSNTGEPITNSIENVEFVDLSEWQRWWKPMVESGELTDYPPFAFYKINGTWTLNSEQSIWRNGTNVCHARDLVVGDTIYDDADNPVVITSVAPLSAAGWYRFDIDGDHSYIVDGLTFHNASRFAVNAGAVDWTWDLSTTTHWASASNGAGGQSAPGSADAVTFDGSSGGHVVTFGFGGTGTFQSITWGAFTGTLDNTVNNNNVTLTASGGWTGSGTGTRSGKLGSATYKLTNATANATPWNMQVTTGLTWDAGASIIQFSAGNASTLRQVSLGGLTYSTITIDANTLVGPISISGGGTITTLNVATPQMLQLPSGTTTTVGNFNVTGSGSTSLFYLISNSSTVSSTLSCTSGDIAFQWAGVRSMTFSGGATFTITNSYDLGGNSGATITAPSAGGGGPVAQFISHQRGTPY